LDGDVVQIIAIRAILCQQWAKRGAPGAKRVLPPRAIKQRLALLRENLHTLELRSEFEWSNKFRRE
jgi:hypothetical protein